MLRIIPHCMYGLIPYHLRAVQHSIHVSILASLEEIAHSFQAQETRAPLYVLYV